MPGSIENLSVKLSVDTKSYKQGFQQASKATKGWAGDTDKAGQAAEQAATKSQGAFSRISQAIRGTRKEANKGADFKVNAKESGFGGILNRIKGIRGDASKGAAFSVRGDESGFSKIVNRIKGVRGDASRGASFSVKSDGSGFSNITNRIKSVRSDAQRGAMMKISGDQSGLKSAGGMIDDVRGNASRGANMKIEVDDSQLQSAKESLGSIGETAAGVAGGLALEDVGSGMADNFRTAQGAVGGFEGRLGASKREAEDLSRVGKDVFAGAWGESLGEVNTAVTTVAQGLGTMGDAGKTQKLTEQAMTLSDAFGIDVTDSVEAARQMSQNMGISSERAFDLIAAGAKNGANKSGDLTDSLQEYSPMFSRLGISGKEAMGMFAEGAKQGVWNTDRLGDAVKEFSVRAVDGSDTTKEGFKMAGLSASDMSAEIAKGGPAAQKAFQQTLAGIRSIDDPQKRTQAGVALFGTLYEDIGEKGLVAMQKGADGLGTVDGAAKKTGDSLYNNMTTKIQGMTRSVQVAISDAGLGGLGSAMGGVAETAGFAGVAVMGLGPIAGKAAGPLASVGGKTASLAGKLGAVTRVAPLAGGALAVMTGPIGLAVAGIALLAGGFYLAYKHSETFRNAIGGIGDAAGVVWGWTSTARENLGAFFNWLPEAAKSVWSWTATGRENLSAFGSWIANSAFTQNLKGIWRDITNPPDLGPAKGVILGLREALGVKGGEKGLNRDVKNLWRDITSPPDWSNAQGVIQGVKNAIKSQPGSASLGKTLKGIWRDIATPPDWSKTKQTLSSLGTTLGNVGSKGKSMWRDVTKKPDWGPATTAIGNFGADTKTKFVNIKNSVTGSLGEAKDKGLARIKELGGGAMSAWTNQLNNAKDRYGKIASSIGSNLRQGKEWGTARIKELGSNAIGAWSNQLGNAKDKYSGIRDTIGTNLRKGKEWGLNRIHELGGGMKTSFGNMVGYAKDFGAKWGERIVEGVRSGVNKARAWMGGLMIAVGNVLGAFGMDKLAGAAKGRGNKLKEPLKMAKGGVVSQGATGGVADGNTPRLVYGEAGKKESYEVHGNKSNLPHAEEYLNTVGHTAVPMGEQSRAPGPGARNLPSPPGTEASGPVTRTVRGASDKYLSWDSVDDSKGTAGMGLSTKYADAYRRADSLWSSGPVDIVQGGNTGIGNGFRVTDVYDPYKAPAWASLYGGIENNTYTMDGYRPESIDTIAVHEMGHTLGLSHGVPAPSIMNYASEYSVGAQPTSNDWDALNALWKTTGGGDKRGGSGGGPSTAKYGPLKGRVHDSGGGAGIYGATNNSLWDSDTFGRVIEVLKNFRVSANTYDNHPPGYPGLAGRSADFWDYAGRGTPIETGLSYKVRDFITSKLSTGLSWTLGEGDAGHTGSDRHVHATWKGQDPNTPNVKYQGGTGEGGGFDWMSIITDALSAIKKPDIGMGVLGEGFGGYGMELVGNAKDWLAEKAKALWGSVKNGIGNLYNNITEGGANRDLGKKMLPASGVPGSWDSLENLWTKESQWDEHAANPTSSAYGIPQALPGSKMASHGSDWKDNPKTQIAWGLDYIRDRYGSTDTAWGHSESNGWYKRGGVIPGPKGEKVKLQAHAGERVLSEKNNQAFERLAKSVEMWSAGAGGQNREVGPNRFNSEADIKKEIRELKEMIKKGIRVSNMEETVGIAHAYHGSPAGRRKQSENHAKERAQYAGTRPEAR